MNSISIRWLAAFSPVMVLVLTAPDCGGGTDTRPRVTHNLQVSRFNTTNLTDARAGEIIAEMGTILQTKDGPTDVPCNVRFVLDGAVTTFATGTGSINSQAGFVAVNGLPGNVKVVNQINWCGGLSPNVIGCAPVPGDSLVVVRFTANQEDVLWVHEFGHNQGLSHRTGNDLVMNPTIGPTKRQINDSECNAYRQP